MKLSLICEDEEYDGLDDIEEYRRPDLVDYIKLRSGMVYSYWVIGDEETGDYYRSINKGEIPAIMSGKYPQYLKQRWENTDKVFEEFEFGLFHILENFIEGNLKYVA